VDVPEAKRAELMRKPLGPPMAPAEIPSFLWFHPITVSSYDETTGDLTLFIKRMGAKDDEWAGQIIKTVQAVKSGALEQSDVRVYVGGPHGNLQVQPANVDHVVLCAGGIGVTPMAAILEDQIRDAGATQNQTTLIWTTRAPSEIKAFAYLFDAIAALPAEQKNRFDVRVFVTSGKENTADVEASASKIVKVRSGRPDFDALVSECAEKTVGHVGVYVCGPEAMSDAAENAAVANKCLVHRETFEF
jgi:NAD(P)H-flavin reductase